MFKLKEIEKGIYQTSTVLTSGEGMKLSFNQYYINDQRPSLISLGSAQMFDQLISCLKEVKDPAGIQYLIIPHFESDECGALSKFLALNKETVPVCSATCARQLIGFGIFNSPKVVKDNEELDLGIHKLRFISTPSEVHLWEGVIAYEEKSRILFSGDIFGQAGDYQGTSPEEIRRGVVSMAYRAMPSKEQLASFVQRVRKLDIKAIAPGHGALITSGINEILEALRS